MVEWCSVDGTRAARRANCGARALAVLRNLRLWSSAARLGLAGLLACAVASCGSDGSPESEDYGNLLNSPAGLVLVEEEHPTGWGRPDCFTCHEVRNIHTVNRTGLPDCQELPEPPPEGCVDLAEIRSIIRNQGEASCELCHGPNGVEP